MVKFSEAVELSERASESVKRAKKRKMKDVNVLIRKKREPSFKATKRGKNRDRKRE